MTFAQFLEAVAAELAVSPEDLSYLHELPDYFSRGVDPLDTVLQLGL